MDYGDLRDDSGDDGAITGAARGEQATTALFLRRIAHPNISVDGDRRSCRYAGPRCAHSQGNGADKD